MNMPTSQQPQWRAQPPATPPAIHTAALARVIGLIRGLTGLAGAVTLIVLTAEAVVPSPYKPSDLIGGFHGRVEGADALAKMGPVTTLTRKNTEAASEPPAYAAMETEAFRQQQLMLGGSMETQVTVANLADGACAAGKMIPRDSRDWGWLGALLNQGCGVGDQVRVEIMNTLKQGGQNNSVLIQRPRAGSSR